MEEQTIVFNTKKLTAELNYQTVPIIMSLFFLKYMFCMGISL